jgi:anti-anti-sigma regulatory factor
MPIAGELTIYTVAQRKAEVLAAFAGETGDAVDLSGITDLDGAGVQLLMFAEAAARAQGRTTGWRDPSRVAVEALGVAGLAPKAGQ